MSTAIETAIAEQLHRLDDQRQAEVLDFVEFLAIKSRAAAPQNRSPEFDPMRYRGTVQWPEIEPSHDLAQFIGVATGLPEDGVAYQRQIRDTERP